MKFTARAYGCPASMRRKARSFAEARTACNTDAVPKQRMNWIGSLTAVQLAASLLRWIDTVEPSPPARLGVSTLAIGWSAVALRWIGLSILRVNMATLKAMPSVWGAGYGRAAMSSHGGIVIA
ncbi:hypothetical protein GGD62_007968 [Bradyrhizobium sp. ERR14]|nr:hypothetical protein [Bradyrhizobium sp. ERR14]